MRVLEENDVADYLREVGLVESGESVAVRLLSGGVSNVVFHVERAGEAHDDFILKQARGRLRVEQPWYCSVERIWREVEVLRVCEQTLTAAANESATGVSPAQGECLEADPTLKVCVPRVLFEDRENYAFAMTAAPPGHRVWKDDLLSGRCDLNVALAAGRLLAWLHGGTWQNPDLAGRLADRTFFEDLRVDPYYRHVARVHEDLRPAMDGVIASLAAHRRCLVHGDFSPKNLLVWAGGLMLVDCEVGHFGDGAFDLGFFLSHLMLKTIYHACPGRQEADMPCLDLARRFVEAYLRAVEPAVPAEELADLQARGVHNLAGCLIARVDGKSPVEYLSRQEHRKMVRDLARRLLQASPPSLPDALDAISAWITADLQ